MERTVTIPTAAIGNAVAAHTVGFVKLEVHDKVEDAIGAGSQIAISETSVTGISVESSTIEPHVHPSASSRCACCGSR